RTTGCRRSYLVDRVDDRTFGQDLWEQGRRSDRRSGRIQRIKRHAVPPDRAEHLSDYRIPGGPVAFERDDALLREHLGNGRLAQTDALVDHASDAACGGQAPGAG